jgi:DNA-binding Lrp family transcriptional regulator
MFEDWSVDVDQAENGETAAQTPVTQGKLDGLDRRLLDVLAAHEGRSGIHPGVPRLAELLGVTVRTVQRHLRGLETTGLVERIAVHEAPEDAEWQRRGHRISHKGRQTSNTYQLSTLSPGPGDTEQAGTAGQTPVTSETMSPLEGKEVVQPVREEGVGKAPRAREPIEIAVEPPESALLDHHPDVGEVLDVIGRSCGEVLVLQGPATYTTARGRQLDLAGPLADFHRAVDQLDRDTCMDGGCAPGHPCRRHTRRANRAGG